MPAWDGLDNKRFREQHLCKVLSIDNPANCQTDSVTISHEVLNVRCYLVPVTIVPIEQPNWHRVMPPYVDDEGNVLKSNTHIYEEKRPLNDECEGED